MYGDEIDPESAWTADDRRCVAISSLALVCLAILLPVLTVGCAGAFHGATPFPTSHPQPFPGPGVTHNVACIATDAESGRPVGGAQCIAGSISGMTNETDGYVLLLHVPACDSEACAGLIVTNDGYETGSVRYTNDRDQDVGVTIRRNHVDPSTFTDAQLRNIKTDLAGVYLDALAPQCPEDPTTHIRCVADNGAPARGVIAGILFTANYRIYTDAQRQIIRDVFTGKRPDKFGLIHHYTHFPISLFCGGGWDYHGIYPPCQGFAKVGLNDALHELYDAGLIPIAFAMEDGEPDDRETPLSVAGVVDPALVRLVTPYWEHYKVNCAMQKVRTAFPTALLYYHNPVDTDAGYEDDCYGLGPDGKYVGGAEWWRHFRDAYGGRGALIQNSDGTVQDVIDRLADFTARFGAGFHGWPTNLDAVWFEDTGSVYNNFWGGGDERALLQRSDQVLSRQPFCVERACGSLAGFGSGGTK